VEDNALSIKPEIIKKTFEIMQKTIKLLVCFLLIFNELNAQNITPIIPLNRKKGDHIYTLRAENGKDSIRFGVSGKGDTFTVQYFNKYQQIMVQNWSFDSLYKYDLRGIVREKFYRIDSNNTDERRLFNAQFSSDSTVKLHNNGQLKRQFVEHSNRPKRPISYEKEFNDNGKLMYSIEYQGYPTINTLNVKRDSNGEIWHILRNTPGNYQREYVPDKLVDTFFYPNGQAQIINSYQHGYFSDYARQEFYTEKGVLIDVLTNDSSSVYPFKDSITQLFGLKNRKNDTIVRPKYKRLESFNVNRFVGYKGDTCVLFRGDGTEVATPLMSEIGYLSEDIIPQMERTVSHSPIFEETLLRYSIRPLSALNPYFKYQIGNKTGIIDRNGEEIFPPQDWRQLSLVSNNFAGLTHYTNDESDKYNHLIGDLKYVGFSNQGHHGATRKGYMNMKGETFFDPTLKYNSYSGYKDYFIVTFIEKGLFTEQNRKVLPCIYSQILPILFTSLFIVSKEPYQAKSYDNQYIINLEDYTDSIIQERRKNVKEGIFNAETNQWLLEDIHAEIKAINVSPEAKQLTGWGLVDVKTAQFFSYFDNKTKKKGLIDNKGAIVLSPDKDELFITKNEKNNLFWYNKNGKYSILNTENPKHKYADNYRFLSPFNMSNKYEKVEKEIYFVAQNHRGKWGVIRGFDEKIMVPFDHEFAGTGGYNAFSIYDDEEGEGGKCVALVKNGQTTFLHDNYVVDSIKIDNHAVTNNLQLVDYYKFINNDKKIFLLSTDGKSLGTPQYKYLFEDLKYILVEDDNGKKWMILRESGEIINYSEENKIKYSNKQD
jgi:hypothetical protein